MKPPFRICTGLATFSVSERTMKLVRFIWAFAVLATAMPITLGAQTSTAVSLEEARKVIQAGNVEWGKARIANDKNTFERMLAPDAYVQLSDRKLTRQEFIDMISTRRPGSVLKRFDASVLTVEPKGDDWVATLLEKIEVEWKDPSSGKSGKGYSAWVTRDGWRKLSGDKWVILYSQEVSHQNWDDTPPVANW